MYFRPLFRDRPAVVSMEQNRAHDATWVTEVDANGQTIEKEEYMGANAGRGGIAGGPHIALGGLNEAAQGQKQNWNMVPDHPSELSARYR
jgi:hypothetical protein